MVNVQVSLRNIGKIVQCIIDNYCLITDTGIFSSPKYILNCLQITVCTYLFQSKSNLSVIIVLKDIVCTTTSVQDLSHCTIHSISKLLLVLVLQDAALDIKHYTTTWPFFKDLYLWLSTMHQCIPLWLKCVYGTLVMSFCTSCPFSSAYNIILYSMRHLFCYTAKKNNVTQKQNQCSIESVNTPRTVLGKINRLWCKIRVPYPKPSPPENTVSVSHTTN